MSSLIEQAAQRLEQLRRAGVVAPTVLRGPAPGAATEVASPQAVPTPLPAPGLGAGSAPGPGSGTGPGPGTGTGAGPGTGTGSGSFTRPLVTRQPLMPVEPANIAPAAAPSSIEAPLLPATEPPEPPKPAVLSKHVELNLEALAAAGIVTPNAPRSHTADQYRVIKRPLIRNAMGTGAAALKHGNLIMVTSAVAGEGKSYTSVNLAMSIAAELDHTVMLVDADVARPSVLKMLGLPAGPGLLDLLEGKADISAVLLKTSIPKLTILPSGTPHARATELLASDVMGVLLDEMSRRYADRIIIFDSPPLLLTTESRVLATQMGQIVVVVQADKTLRADVQQALSTIESCPVRMMLLNKAHADAVGGYGYGYGYGYGQEKPAG